MVKRITVLCLVLALLALLAALAGCTSSPQQPTTTQPAEAPTELPLSDSTPIPGAEAFAGGSGTEADPYRIESAQQLALLAKYVNEQNKDFNQACYVQTADIVMNDISNVENWATEAPEWCWTPIGSKFLVDFLGHYDGNGHSISGMYIFSSRPANSEGPGDHVGLFGSVYQGSVKNVILKDSYVFANNQSAAAGIVGEAKYSQISNCVNEATVETRKTHNVGGICGDAFIETNIRDCTNTGVICDYESPTNERPAVGGICGHSYTVSNCTNSGPVTGSGGVGGICGDANASIENCQNSGAISNPCSGMSYAGGIVGNTRKDIRNCHNSGPISGSGEVGGIAGSFSNMSVPDEDPTSIILEDCVNEGSITELLNAASTSLSRIGGIIGGATVYEGNLVIRNSINTANIYGEGKDGSAGGIFGYLFSMGTCEDGQGLVVENCRNTGNVTHLNLAGGIVGDCSVSKAPVTIRSCSNTGTITATTSNGGIIGQLQPGLYPQTIESCENSGEIAAADRGSGGIIGAFFAFSLDTDKPAEILVSKCMNTGPITGKNIGGIVGIGMDGRTPCRIEDCVNKGRISGDNILYAGGILGNDATAGVTLQDGPAFIIRRCVNLGDVVYGDGTLPFDNNITYRTEFEDHIDVESATIIMLGGKSIGGIVGKVNQSIIEDCINCGKLFAQDGTTFLVTLADFASYDPESDENLLMAGAICGLYLFLEEFNNAENIGIHDCIYADTACVGYSEFGLFDGAHTIRNVQAVSESDAQAAAEKLMK